MKLVQSYISEGSGVDSDCVDSVCEGDTSGECTLDSVKL